MKKLLLCFSLTLTSYLSFAQFIHVDTPKYRIVKKDTINIKGVVYDALNKPAVGVIIVSKNNEINYNKYPAYTQTDKEGKFELKGALFNDTLKVWAQTYINFINNGSRYIEIYLPPIPENGLKPNAPITAKRKFAKQPTPTFKVITNASINDYYGVLGGVRVPPSVSGGSIKFAADIRSKVIYPEKAIENNIEGEVEIGFTIDRDGSLIDFKVLRGINYGCEESVINALKNSQKWRPAVFNARPVTAHSSIIINFKLTDN